MRLYVREISEKPWRPWRLETNTFQKGSELEILSGFREKQKELFDEACGLFPPEHRGFDSEDHMLTTLEKRIRRIGHESTLTVFVLDHTEIPLKKILEPGGAEGSGRRLRFLGEGCLPSSLNSNRIKSVTAWWSRCRGQ
ncbi:hypothetical protein E4U32_007032 [Claviceps aff. humidiphila group G2b]|nr:hypothetical protein E4U32_007032 [Claviceps aff. humidiphila group G2b]